MNLRRPEAGRVHEQDGQTGAVVLRQCDGVEIGLVRVRGKVSRIKDFFDMNHGSTSCRTSRLRPRLRCAREFSLPLRGMVSLSKGCAKYFFSWSAITRRLFSSKQSAAGARI